MYISEQEKTSVLRALGNPEYDWRTTDGIVRETRLPAEKVQLILDLLSDKIVRSSRLDSRGRFLYTTRERYYRNRRVANRFLSVLTDRIR
jgi:hypothetical protein